MHGRKTRLLFSKILVFSKNNHLQKPCIVVYCHYRKTFCHFFIAFQRELISLNTTAIRARKKKGGASTGSSFDNLEIFLLHLPTTIWYLIFCYAPMFGVIIAFKNYVPAPGVSFIYNLFENCEWSGLQNFKFLFSSSYFQTMMRNTIVYNLIFIVLAIIIPVSLAIMISQLYSKKLAKVCQTMMFLPHFLSWVVVGYFVYAFLATDAGLFNNVAKALGIGNPKHQWYRTSASGRGSSCS